MNILVTGGAGFIGSHIAEALIRDGHSVTVLDNLYCGKKEFVPAEAEFVEGDIRNPYIKQIFASHHFDAVYHEAAQTQVPLSLESPDFDADENILGLIHILECACQTGVRKLIFSSSAAIYGSNARLPLSEGEIPAPDSFYGLSKWTGEQYIRLFQKLHGLSYTILRYSNVYGPRQGASGEGGVIYKFAENLIQNKGLTIFGDGTQTRDFISVCDIAAANVAALTHGDNETINISSGSECSLNQLAQLMQRLTHAHAGIRYEDSRPGDIHRSCLSRAKARELLTWQPRTDLTDGLQQTLRYYRSL